MVLKLGRWFVLEITKSGIYCRIFAVDTWFGFA